MKRDVVGKYIILVQFNLSFDLVAHVINKIMIFKFLANVKKSTHPLFIFIIFKFIKKYRGRCY